MAGSAKPNGLPVTATLKRLIFWDFARATWQYDLVVGLILLFVFATPREWFHDQPKESSIVLIASNHGTEQVFIAPDLLADTSPAQRPARVSALIRQRTGKYRRVIRIETIRDQAEQELKGFIAYTAPQ